MPSKFQSSPGERKSEQVNVRIALLTSLTMIAFAANSVLCRLALIDSLNHPVSFAAIRLFSGALVLILFLFKAEHLGFGELGKAAFVAPLMLVSYATLFSLSYVNISTGTGALILFGSVQLTMVGESILKGQKLTKQQSLGILVAVLGLIYLLLPGLQMPPILSAAFMAMAGVSWGIYSLLGRTAQEPLKFTARNFVMTLPAVVPLVVLFPIQLSQQGWILAIISGAVTSGLGYALWYFVIKNLVTSTAAIVQLTVPLIATFGGVLFLGEQVTFRLVASSVLILAGIVIKTRSRPS